MESLKMTQQSKAIAEARNTMAANARTKAVIKVCAQHGISKAQTANFIESGLSSFCVDEQIKKQKATAEAIATARQVAAMRVK